MTSALPGFELAVRAHDGDAAPVVTVTVRGEIDATNAGGFESQLSSVLTEAAAVVDLSAVTFMDSAAYGVLERLGKRGSLAIALSPESLMRRASTIMGLSFHDDVETARRALRRRA